MSVTVIFTVNMNKRKNPYIDDEASCDSDRMDTDGEDESTEEDEAGPINPPPKKKPAKEGGGKFRLHAKNLFLTYPKCDLDKEDAYQQLENKLGKPEEYIIAREKHLVMLQNLKCMYIMYSNDAKALLLQYN